MAFSPSVWSEMYKVAEAVSARRTESEYRGGGLLTLRVLSHFGSRGVQNQNVRRSISPHECDRLGDRWPERICEWENLERRRNRPHCVGVIDRDAGIARTAGRRAEIGNPYLASGGHRDIERVNKFDDGRVESIDDSPRRRCDDSVASDLETENPVAAHVDHIQLVLRWNRRWLRRATETKAQTPQDPGGCAHSSRCRATSRASTGRRTA